MPKSLTILLLACLAFSASAQDTTAAARPDGRLAKFRLSFSCQNCPPAEALVQLSRASGVNISFSNSWFEACPPVSYSADNESFTKILEKITACGRVGWQLLNGQVVLFKKQTKLRLAGFVEDAESGDRLLGAGIRVWPDGLAGTVTNEFGFFSLLLEPGEFRVVASYIGYQAASVPVSLGSGEAILKIKLRASSALPEVVILAASRGSATDSTRSFGAKTELPLAGLRSLAMPGGEADLLRLAAQQAGVQTGADGLGGLHVRGGNADQNLVLLDDVPVYNPTHALGLLSIFNTGAVSNAQLWKGNFPARYGGRAASVLDVRTRDGNFREYHGRVSAGIFASTLELEGPLIQGKSSFLLGARFTYLDPWVKFFSKQQNLLTFPADAADVHYQFYDLNAKWNRNFSARDKIYLSFYAGNDDFSDQFQQAYFQGNNFFQDRFSVANSWGNLIAAFRWNHLLRPNLFCNSTLTYSRFHYQSRLAFQSELYRGPGKTESILNLAQHYNTLIRDISAKTDFTWFQSNQLTWRAGGTVTQHYFQPGALSVDLLLPGQTPGALDSLDRIFLDQEQLAALEVEAYAEADWRIGHGWNLSLGGNFSVFDLGKTTYPAFQPRLNLRKNLGEGWQAWVGVHRLNQNLHQIGSYNISLPFELWVPSTRKVKPEQVWQASGGLGLTRSRWSAQVEAYWKKMDRVLTFLSAYDALYAGGAENANGWEDRIAAGQGWSRGVEVSAEKTSGRFRASLAYTLSWTWRRFPDINQGFAFPFRFDRRHDLKISLSQRFSRHIELNVGWTFSSGNPITLSGVKFQHISPETGTTRSVVVYSEVNGYRLPPYHRLDVAANFQFGRHGIQVGVYNAYNRQNPFFLRVDSGAAEKGRAVAYTLLPVFPVFRYEFKF